MAIKISDLKRRGSLLPLTSLTWIGITKIFNLQSDIRSADTWTIPEEDVLDVPNELLERLNQISRILNHHHDPHEEFMAGLRLDAILVEALCAEREHTNKPVALALDTKLLPVEVTYEEEKRVLDGKADYTVWYDKNELANTQFVVVNTTKVGTTMGTCLAYMATIHRIKKENHQKNTSVYGCSLDGELFTLLKIDGNSRYSICYHRWTTEPSHNLMIERKIYTHFRRIIRSAADCSSSSVGSG